MGFEAGRINHYGLLFSVFGGQTRNYPSEYAFLAAALPVAVERFLRAIGGRRAPAPPNARALPSGSFVSGIWNRLR